jgi:hypothetical protein
LLLTPCKYTLLHGSLRARYSRSGLASGITVSRDLSARNRNYSQRLLELYLVTSYRSLTVLIHHLSESFNSYTDVFELVQAPTAEDRPATSNLLGAAWSQSALRTRERRTSSRVCSPVSATWLALAAEHTQCRRRAWYWRKSGLHMDGIRRKLAGRLSHASRGNTQSENTKVWI